MLLCPYYNQGEWDAHEKSAHNFKCATCEEIFPTGNELSEHLKSSHEISSQPPNSIPTTDSSDPDDSSKNVTADDANFGPAVQISSGERNSAAFNCDHCDFTGNLRRTMKTHMKQKHCFPLASFVSCDICDYRTMESASLTQHILDVHMKITPEISINKLQSFHCHKCIFTALKESTLRDHIKTKHESTALQCDLCPYIAPLQINMKRHIAVANGRIQCDQCDFTSSSQFSRALHTEQDQTQPQPPKEQLFPCILCGMTISQSCDLDSHIKRRHSPPHEEPPIKTPNHTLTMVLEEQIDMAKNFIELKNSIDAQLSEIRHDQETLRDDMKQLVQGNTVLLLIDLIIYN